MIINIATDEPAWLLLEDIQFHQEWLNLYECCPWSLAYQSPAFSKTWYTSYGAEYKPILVYSRSEFDLSLSGLWLLAISKDGLIAHVGAHQAEYQVWICLPTIADIFPELAIATLEATFYKQQLNFQYLPPNVPLDWISNSKYLYNRYKLNRISNPIFNFSYDFNLNQWTKNKSNKTIKYEVAQLKKIGPLQFKRIVILNEFDEILNEIIQFYDSRMATTYGIKGFCGDSLKKDFHLGMFKQLNLLHVTIMKAGDTLISAQIHVKSKDRIHLGILAQNPNFYKYGVGSIHLIYLINMLAEENIAALDLTPPAEGYKLRWSNNKETVSQLIIYSSVLIHIYKKIHFALRSSIKYILSACGILKK